MNRKVMASRGGIARAKRLSRERRSQISKNAARARWGRRDPREILQDVQLMTTFCRKHKIRRLEVFGSVARGTFGPKSDVDLLYVAEGPFTLDRHTDMRQELERLFDRDVDLLSLRAIKASRNKYRRESILGSSVVVHAEP